MGHESGCILGQRDLHATHYTKHHQHVEDAHPRVAVSVTDTVLFSECHMVIPGYYKLHVLLDQKEETTTRFESTSHALQFSSARKFV